MGLLTANQVTRKVLLLTGLTAAGPGLWVSGIDAQITDYLVLAAAVDNTDAADQFFEMSLQDPGGNIQQLGTATIPAPVPPSDETVVSLTDPTGDLNLSGLVVPAGWKLKVRCQPGFTTGGMSVTLTAGVA